jgi:hypothetical protein
MMDVIEDGILRTLSPEEEAAFLADQQALAAQGRRGDLANRLQAAYQDRLLEGVAYQGKSFSLDEASQRRITSAYNFAQDSKAGGVAWPDGFAWRANDDSYLPLPTADDAIAFCRAAASEATRLQFALFGRKDALAATDDADLAGFDPAAGLD